MRTYYKVIVIEVGTLESHITDERHFATIQEAEQFANTFCKDKIGVVLQMN